MADEKPKTATVAPPYVSYRTFRDYVSGLRAGIPGVVERGQLTSYSGAVQTQLLHALRHFGLIDAGGHPQASLEKFATGEGEERQRLLQGMLRSGYPFLFGGAIKLSNATTGQVQRAFENNGAGGDTIRKCAAFFIAAAKDAGLQVSPFLKIPRTTKNGTVRRRKVSPATQHENVPPESIEKDRVGQKSDMEMLINILSPDMADDQKQAVWTLIQYLKEKEGAS